MNGEKRREEIIEKLQSSSKAVSGAELAKIFKISRQVIVHDIALLRAGKYNIISTHRGYILEVNPRKQRIYKVKHNSDQIAAELNAIVDAGGHIVDVFVNHKVYGEFRVALSIHSRKDVNDFVASIKSSKVSPLSRLTNEYHYHTVEADSDGILDYIEKELEEQGYLVP
jgi:hypothetical protein